MSTSTKVAGTAADWVDQRVGAGKWLSKNLRKVFPDHWSFMLGEIALYSFIVLLLTGVWLTLFFNPSMKEVVYDGSYVPLQGVKMSQAYESTLNISFDVRGGLLIRQIHHWAALLFVASVSVHALRVFFTGAFRKPRELNWLIGNGLLTLAILEGFSGYSLPDDLLSGTGLRIAQSIMLAIPLIGTYLSFFLFGGEFPGTDIIPRLYSVHILLLPGLILGLLTAHLLLVWYQKHTQWPGPGRTNKNVVGFPLFPVYVAKAGGFFFVVFGALALMGAWFGINSIWVYGPYIPTSVTADSQPDWYIGWLDGGVRLMPNWEIVAFGYNLSLNLLIPALVVPGIMFTLLALYPWIEAKATGDKREHHLLDRPRNAPVRTGLGAMGITFYVLLWITGGNDIIAQAFNWSINTITWTIRILIFVLPPLVFVITKRICLGLQARDREKLLHGKETGIIKRLPSGEFIEIHAPVSDEERAVLVANRHSTYRPIEAGPDVDENGVANPKKGRIGRALSRFYFADRVETPTDEEIDEGQHHAAEQLASVRGPQAAGEITAGSSH
jgi:ubiquinol-cytochrome c reductase cytochrome b subunit